MYDIWIYIVMFVLGAVAALIDNAASAVECSLNKKLLKFLPIRHIPTVVAVIFALSAFIYYGYNNPSGRDTSVAILCTGLMFLAVTIAMDLCIIFFIGRKRK